MPDFGDIVKQLVSMGARFESLSDQVLRIEDRQIKLLDRLSKLEERLNTINESSRSAAQAGVAELKAQLIERITRIEVEQRTDGRAAPELETSDGNGAPQ